MDQLALCYGFEYKEDEDISTWNKPYSLSADETKLISPDQFAPIDLRNILFTILNTNYYVEQKDIDVFIRFHMNLDMDLVEYFLNSENSTHKNLIIAIIHKNINCFEPTQINILIELIINHAFSTSSNEELRFRLPLLLDIILNYIQYGTDDLNLNFVDEIMNNLDIILFYSNGFIITATFISKGIVDSLDPQLIEDKMDIVESMMMSASASNIVMIFECFTKTKNPNLDFINLDKLFFILNLEIQEEAPWCKHILKIIRIVAVIQKKPTVLLQPLLFHNLLNTTFNISGSCITEITHQIICSGRFNEEESYNLLSEIFEKFEGEFLLDSLILLCNEKETNNLLVNIVTDEKIEEILLYIDQLDEESIQSQDVKEKLTFILTSRKHV